MLGLKPYYLGPWTLRDLFQAKWPLMEPAWLPASLVRACTHVDDVLNSRDNPSAEIVSGEYVESKDGPDSVA